MRTSMLRSVSLLVLAGAAVASQAVLTVYIDRSAFESALTGLTTETFSTDQGFVVGDNLYNGVDYRITGSIPGGNSIGGGVYNGDEFGDGNSLDLVFGSSVNGFGADFSRANTADGLTFTILGQTVALKDYLSDPGTGFFGVVSSDSFTVVDFKSGNEIYALDNLTYGSNPTSAVPGPVAALPFALMAIKRRRTARK